ncbi:MAG TPA: hypothetical protein VLA34_05705 [Candidatus Krumholzibacterium sp.]|nr:hypothetical protein [Candidatus Krumholzibacterium sp.]
MTADSRNRDDDIFDDEHLDPEDDDFPESDEDIPELDYLDYIDDLSTALRKGRAHRKDKDAEKERKRKIEKKRRQERRDKYKTGWDD